MASSSSTAVDVPAVRPPTAAGIVASGRRPPIVLLVVAVAVGVVFLGPLAYVVWRNVELGSDVWSVVWSADTLEPVRRALWLGTVVALSTAVIGTGLAWLTVRCDLPGRGAFRLLAPLPLVFPSFVGAAALIAGFSTGGLVEQLLTPLGIDSLPNVRGFGGAWLVLTLFTYPYVYLPVAARMRDLPPSLEESARLLGRRPAAVFASVVLPQVSGAIWAGVLLVFLYTCLLYTSDAADDLLQV